jgi:hypothetical protein
MKRKLTILFLLLAALACAERQISHSATLTWSDGQNPAGTTYSVYRAPGLCSGTPVFAKLASALSATTYQTPRLCRGIIAML